jgi:hypothetical protein
MNMPALTPTPEAMSLRAFCTHIKVKPSYGIELRKAGRLVMTEDGKQVRVAESIAQIAATRDPSKVNVAARHAAARGDAAQTGHAPAAAAAPAGPTFPPVDAGEGGGDGDEPGETRSFQASKASKEHYAALRERVAYLKDIGQLMERPAVVAAFADAGATLRGKLEAWAAVLPPQLIGRDEEAIRGAIAGQVEQLLHDVAEGFRRAATREA